MRLLLHTRVRQPLAQVKAGFDKTLFKALAPPFPRMRLLRFDGSTPGDLIALELNFLLMRQHWLSEITEEGGDVRSWYFVDEGRQLPAPLHHWRHRHIMKTLPSGETRITDQVDFHTAWPWLDLLLYPFVFILFLYRKPIYRRYFG